MKRQKRPTWRDHDHAVWNCNVLQNRASNAGTIRPDQAADAFTEPDHPHDAEEVHQDLFDIPPSDQRIAVRAHQGLFADQRRSQTIGLHRPAFQHDGTAEIGYLHQAHQFLGKAVVFLMHDVASAPAIELPRHALGPGLLVHQECGGKIPDPAMGDVVRHQFDLRAEGQGRLLQIRLRHDHPHRLEGGNRAGDVRKGDPAFQQPGRHLRRVCRPGHPGARMLRPVGDRKVAIEGGVIFIHGRSLDGSIRRWNRHLCG